MAVVERLVAEYDVNDRQARAAYDRLRRDGKKTNDDLVRGANQVEQSQTRAAGATRLMTAAMGRLSSMSGQTRFAIQNTAFQVADMAVMLEMGAGAARTFGQQLPQIAGSFGPIGAGIGAVLAVGIPLVGMFTRGGEEAKTLEDRLKDLASAVSDYRDAAEAANISTEELVEKYGRASEAARVFLTELQTLAEINAVKELDSQVQGLATRFQNLGKVTDEQLTNLINMAERSGLSLSFIAGSIDSGALKGLQEFQKELGLTTRQVLELLPAMREVGEAEGPTEARIATANLREEMVRVLGSANDMTDAQRKFYEELVVSADKAADLEGAIEKAKDQSGWLADAINAIDFSNPIAGARSLSGIVSGLLGQANTLLTTLGNAANLRQRAQMGVEYGNPLDPLNAFGGSGRAGSDYIQTAYGGTLRTLTEDEIFVPLDDRPKTGGGRRSGRGGKSKAAEERKDLVETIREEIVELQRELDLIGKSTEEVAELEAKWRIMDLAKKEGIKISDEVQAKIDEEAKKYGQLTAALEKGKLQQDEYMEGIEEIASAMNDVVFEGESMRDALAGIFQGIAKDLLQSGITELLMNIFPKGSKGGSILGVIGGALGFGGSFEGGGRTWSGPRSGGIDGRGGRPAILHPDEIVTDLRRGNVPTAPRDIRVSVAGANGDKQIMEMVRRGVNQGLADYDEALPGRVRQVTADNSQRYE